MFLFAFLKFDDLNFHKFFNWHCCLICLYCSRLVYALISSYFCSFIFFFLFDLHRLHCRQQPETSNIYFLRFLFSTANFYLMDNVWTSVCSLNAFKILANLSLNPLVNYVLIKKLVVILECKNLACIAYTQHQIHLLNK